MSEAVLENLHDAELLGVVIERERETLRLEFKLASGRRAILQFVGARLYKIGDLRPQNVISRALNAGQLSESEFEDVLRWACSSGRGDLLVSPALLANLAEDIKASRSRFFYIDPSCGAEIVVISDSVSAIELD